MREQGTRTRASSQDSGASPLASCSEASEDPDVPSPHCTGHPLGAGPVPVGSSGSALPSPAAAPRSAGVVCEEGVTIGSAP